MRTAFAAALFCLTVVAVGARPDDPRKVWNWPKEKAFKDGPLVYRVESLHGGEGSSEWELTVAVKNAGDAGLSRRDAFARWFGVKVTTDDDVKVVVTRSAASAGDFPANREGEYTLSFGNRPGPKAAAVHIDFAAVEGRPPLRMTIPAAKVRGLKDKL